MQEVVPHRYIYEGDQIKEIIWGVHILLIKLVPAEVREGVQMFQRRSKFSSELRSGGGGTNLGVHFRCDPPSPLKNPRSASENLLQFDGRVQAVHVQYRRLLGRA